MSDTHIGILTIADPRRGLWRDAESLLWVLDQPPPRWNGRRPAAVSLFPVSDYGSLERSLEATPAVAAQQATPQSVAPGTRFGAWLSGLDLLMVCEKLLPRVFALARRHGVRVVYIPNLDWAILGNSTPQWIKAVQAAGCEVWAKTEQVAAALERVGIASRTVLWSIPDAVVRSRAAGPDGPITFLLNAGMGGWHNRRGADIAFRAFALAQQQLGAIRLVVKSIRSIARHVPAELLELPNLELIEGMQGRDELARLYQCADAVLYPSRWEGFGLSLLEALHAGTPVIASDGWPMNELIEHGHNGLLAQAAQAGTMRLAPRWECSPAALAQEMIRFAIGHELRRRLTCPAPHELVARQHRFALRVRELLLGEPPPRVVLLRPKLNQPWRRSEEYWADALRMHGYHVDIAFFESPVASIQQLLSRPHDFVLAGKAPAALLRTVGGLSDRPLIVWHHDECGRLQRWHLSIDKQIDLLCVPESGLNLRLPALTVPVLTLLPGVKLEGDRGPGRRPIAVSERDSGPDVVFLGNRRSRGNRLAILRALSRHFDVQVYGRDWATTDRLKTHGAIWGQPAIAINQRAKTVLSISSSSTTPHYTSNRLFHSCGAGACVIVEAYPGLEDHYPAGSVAGFRDAEECVQITGRLLADARLRAHMRAAAEDHTWRNHTWADRIAALLERVYTLQLGRTTRGEQILPGFWDERARRMGQRAVGYFRWNAARFQAESQASWDRLRPHVQRLRAPSDQLLLDFGCGAGRFARRLAAQGFRVMGVDASHALVELAAAQAGAALEFCHIRSGTLLPFEASTFDVLWTFTVLQHIPDQVLTGIVRELRRVLRAGALIILCENTEPSKGRLSKSGHVVFRSPDEYMAMFPGVCAIDAFVVEGERHTVLAGRLVG